MRIGRSADAFHFLLGEWNVRWYVVRMMANVDGYSELRAEVVDGEIRTTGQGRDPGGELVERGRYYDISADGYSFILDRSYDGGKTWIRPFVSYRAARRGAARIIR